MQQRRAPSGRGEGGRNQEERRVGRDDAGAWTTRSARRSDVVERTPRPSRLARDVTTPTLCYVPLSGLTSPHVRPARRTDVAASAPRRDSPSEVTPHRPVHDVTERLSCWCWGFSVAQVTGPSSCSGPGPGSSPSPPPGRQPVQPAAETRRRLRTLSGPGAQPRVTG